MENILNIAGGITNSVANAANAYMSANPIVGESELQNNISNLSNVSYAAGDLNNLANQFLNATNIQTNGLLHRDKQNFRDYVSVALGGVQSGAQLGNAIDKTNNTNVTTPVVSAATNQLNNQSTDALLANTPMDDLQAAAFAKNGGRLFGIGGALGQLISGPLNVTMLGIGSAVQDKQLDKLNARYKGLANQAMTNNLTTFNNTLHDSTGMIADQAALSLKAYGGPLGYFWNTFDNGVKVIKEGGTHEENPHEGVQQGIAPDGFPNLVEEGEVIFNNYVFSKRLKLSEKDKELFKLKGDISFADAALQISKESEERPNDSISKNGLKDSMMKLQYLQESLKAKKEATKQKRLENKLATELAQLPIDEQMMLAQQPKQQQMIDPTAIQQPQMFAKGGHLFSGNEPTSNTLDFNTLTWFDQLDERNPNPYIVRNGQYAYLPEGFNPQNPYTNIRYVNPLNAVKDENGNEVSPAVPGHWVEIPGPGPRTYEIDPFAQTLRTAPIFGSMAMALKAAGEKPNYQHQDAAIRATNNIPYVNYNPIGNYTRYQRIDPNTTMNATRAAYAQALSNMQNAGASRAAVNAQQLLGLYGLNQALGQAQQQGYQYNNTLSEKEDATKLGIDQAMLNASLQASAANQARSQAYATMVGQMAPYKQAIDDQIATNKYTTQAGVYQNIGNYGNDRLALDQMKFGLDTGIWGPLQSQKKHGGKLKYKSYNRKRK